MSSSPPQALLDRIANAISRIERANSQAAVVSPASPDAGKVQALEQRHAKLRQESGAALAELDALLAGSAS